MYDVDQEEIIYDVEEEVLRLVLYIWRHFDNNAQRDNLYGLCKERNQIQTSDFVINFRLLFFPGRKILIFH